MTATKGAAADYWGYLIKSDKTPSKLLHELLLGIANYIIKDIAPWHLQCLAPEKLATFYRLVGGDYDPLFVETPHPTLSFIYQSLGCFHTLQPTADAFAPPSVPALTSEGYVRWQTIQLLLGPDEHVSYLQQALKRFDIVNPVASEVFPKVLPRDAFPAVPDEEMTRWHETVRELLEREAETEQAMLGTVQANGVYQWMILPITFHTHMAKVMRDFQGRHMHIPGFVQRFDGLPTNAKKITETTSLDLAVTPNDPKKTIDTGAPQRRKYPRDGLAAPIAIFEPEAQAPSPFPLRAPTLQSKRIAHLEGRATTLVGAAIATTTDSFLHPHSAIDAIRTTTSTKLPPTTRHDNLSTAHIFLPHKSNPLGSRESACE